ncbi:TPA_asm: hypothetical protein vir555_00058 [Caudoviricetes sp. vir555]|nr:TPA_asm: hypothetical protein vir555_00058 [Caudoviricetes sp. vir555]
MKRLVLIILGVLLCTPLYSDMNPYIAGVPVSCTENCGDYLVCQNFEGTGYDNSETWTESVPEGGTVDEDDTTSPVMSGSQQLLITGGTSAVSSVHISFGEQSEVWGHLLIKVPDATPGFDIELFRLGNASTSQRALVYLRTSGILRASAGGANSNSIGTLSDNTAYRIWYHYRASTGSDGVWDIWVSGADTLTRPASPWCTISTHTETSNVWTFMHRIGAGCTIRSDKILIDNAEFTTVCE